jgi:hypothetical protein
MIQRRHRQDDALKPSSSRRDNGSELVELAVLFFEVVQEDGGIQRTPGSSNHQLISTGIQRPLAVHLLRQPILQSGKFSSRYVLLQAGKVLGRSLCIFTTFQLTWVLLYLPGILSSGEFSSRYVLIQDGILVLGSSLCIFTVFHITMGLLSSARHPVKRRLLATIPPG